MHAVRTNVPARLAERGSGLPITQSQVTGLGAATYVLGACINSAIDELIPARHRGRIDLVINGTYWAGAGFGALLTVPILTQLPVGWGWRGAFGLGVVLGLVILLVRRHVPESPRWLFIHGRGEEAEALVRGVEEEVEREDKVALEPVDRTIEIHTRKTIGFGTIAKTLITRYPKRAAL